MRFTIGAAALASASGYVAKVVASRPTKPVLAGVLITAEEGAVTLFARNNTSACTARACVPAEVAEAGTFLVMGRMFSEICANVKGDLEVRVEGSQMRIMAGKAKFALPLMDTSEYPMPASMALERIGSVCVDDLVSAVETVAIAADPANPLPILTGVYVEFDRKSITLAATDRYRLASRKLAWESALSNPVTMVIPGKELHDAVKGLAKDGETVHISVAGSDQIVLAGQTRTATVSTTDGDYPAWRALLPKSFAGTATVGAKAALEVLDRVSIVAGRSDAVSVAFGGDVLQFSCGQSEGAGSADEIAAAFTGEQMTLRFNPQYLREGLAACGDQEVSLNLVSTTKPAVISPSDGSPYSYLVMTIRPDVAA